MDYEEIYFIVGTAKSGTTSLFEYMVQHPLVVRPTTKEIRYLYNAYKNVNGLYYKGNKPTKRQQRSFKKEYLELLMPDPPYPKTSVIGEASGYINKPKAIDLIGGYFPNARIIVILRNPVDRLWSWHINNMSGGFKDRYEGYVARRIFDDYDNIKYLYSVFAKSQVMVIKSQDMFSDAKGVLHNVFRHIRVPYCDVNISPHNVSGKRKLIMPPALKKMVRRDFKHQNEQLYALIGRDMGW